VNKNPRLMILLLDGNDFFTSNTHARDPTECKKKFDGKYRLTARGGNCRH
jgi:hypothetical protein